MCLKIACYPRWRPRAAYAGLEGSVSQANIAILNVTGFLAASHAKSMLITGVIRLTTAGKHQAVHVPFCKLPQPPLCCAHMHVHLCQRYSP